MLRRRREISIPYSFSLLNLLIWLLFWFHSWLLSQSSRISTLLLAFDKSLSASDRGSRGSPAAPFLSSPLSIILVSKSTKEEPSFSRDALLIKSEKYFTVLLNYPTSGSASTSPETYNHRNSWMARLILPPAHQIDHQWLRFKLSETFWRMEALGPSFPAPPPVKSQAACDKTLIWLEVPFNGLGPRRQQQLLSPNYQLLKTSCKRSGPTVKALKPNYMTKAQPPYVPRFVYFTLLSSHIFLMFLFSVLNGRRRHPNRIATSLRLIDSYHSRGLMEGLAISLLKNCSFASPIQSSSFMERTVLPSSFMERTFLPSSFMERTFLPSSFMERTISLNCIWFPTSLLRNRSCILTIFLEVKEVVPAIPEVMDQLSTSQCHWTVTNQPSSGKSMDLVSSTHYALACGKLLLCSCLRVGIDLSSNYLNFLLHQSFVMLLSISFDVSNHEVVEFANFVPVMG